MPLIDGVNCFGSCAKTRRRRAERAVQKNAYGGLDGVERLDMGGRGMFTTVEGRLEAPDAGTLNAMILLIESFDDGNTHTLVDQFGNAWPDVVYAEFEPVGDLNGRHGVGGYTQRYRATFEHLTG